MRIVITLALWLLAAVASAQVQPLTFSATKATTLVGGAEVLTIQKATGETSRTIQFLSATMYCSVVCLIELETAGNEATGTALTPIALRAGTPVADAFHTSDVGDGSTIRTYHLAAGQEISIGLSSIQWPAAAGLRNLTLRTDSITGDVELTFVWSEVRP